MKYVILKLLKDKPRHGYEVMKELKTRCTAATRRRRGTVYTTLQWLNDEGLVVAKDVEEKRCTRHGRGRKFLDEHATWWTTSSTACREAVDRRSARDGRCEPVRSVAREGGLRTGWKAGDKPRGSDCGDPTGWWARWKA